MIILEKKIKAIKAPIIKDYRRLLKLYLYKYGEMHALDVDITKINYKIIDDDI